MNGIFEASYLCWICNSKSIKFCPNQHVDLHRIFFTDDFLKIKKGLELASRRHFLLNFLIKNYFVTLHKLAKFHYQTAFTSQVIQEYVFHVSCLGIWWRHDVWISKMLKIDYLNNEKSFQSEIKSIFPCFESAVFYTSKQTCKNVADTTFKRGSI